MDSQSTPLAVEADDSKPKLASKPAKVEPPFSRQKRVFGTARSTNIRPKPEAEKKHFIKSKFRVPQKQPKSNATKLVEENIDKKSPENVNPGLNKKSDAFSKRLQSQEKDSAEPKTPAASHFRSKPEVAATPYYSAGHCSKCRFDRLETSSYWVTQIKLAESVSKHFVAAQFFHLAYESQAEPIRNLGMELRRYMGRHGYLSEQKEWIEVAVKYGLLKVKTNIGGVDSSTETCRKSESDAVLQNEVGNGQ